MPSELCPQSYALRAMPSELCLQNFALRAMPSQLCPQSYAPRAMPSELCPRAHRAMDSLSLEYSLCSTRSLHILVAVSWQILGFSVTWLRCRFTPQIPTYALSMQKRYLHTDLLQYCLQQSARLARRIPYKYDEFKRVQMQYKYNI